jgi:hypothetical protein
LFVCLFALPSCSEDATTAEATTIVAALPIPSQVHLDLDATYDENIVRLTKQMGVKRKVNRGWQIYFDKPPHWLRLTRVLVCETQ